MVVWSAKVSRHISIWRFAEVKWGLSTSEETVRPTHKGASNFGQPEDYRASLHRELETLFSQTMASLSQGKGGNMIQRANEDSESFEGDL